ncbi:MAG: hypothetical protein ABR555_10905 [Pyrinomonadaceae bacterium]
MIRRVAFGKAVIAGATGAIAWEIAARMLLLLDVPFFDLVFTLGTMIVGGGHSWVWWPVGIALHATVGAIWAIFYAYFFWSTYESPPVVQGLIFSLGPATLAGLIMVPQMSFMHVLILEGKLPPTGFFGIKYGWSGPVGIVIGHLIYGAVMGALYIKPVGYRVGRRIVPYG